MKNNISSTRFNNVFKGYDGAVTKRSVNQDGGLDSHNTSMTNHKEKPGNKIQNRFFTLRRQRVKQIQAMQKINIDNLAHNQSQESDRSSGWPRQIGGSKPMQQNIYQGRAFAPRGKHGQMPCNENSSLMIDASEKTPQFSQTVVNRMTESPMDKIMKLSLLEP